MEIIYCKIETNLNIENIAYNPKLWGRKSQSPRRPGDWVGFSEFYFIKL